MFVNNFNFLMLLIIVSAHCFPRSLDWMLSSFNSRLSLPKLFPLEID